MVDLDFNQIIDKLARIEQKLEDFIDTINESTRLSRDNENRIIRLEDKVKEHDRDINGIKDNSKWLLRAVVGAVITALVGLVFGLLTLSV